MMKASVGRPDMGRADPGGPRTEGDILQRPSERAMLDAFTKAELK
jgi:hypothetical protein